MSGVNNKGSASRGRLRRFSYAGILSASILAVTSSAAFNAAYAEDKPVSPGTAEQLSQVQSAATDDISTVVVTGTRTSRSAIDSPVPIQVLSAEDLQKTGKVNIRDALQQLVPSYNNASGWTGGSGEAIKSASLRGLQADQALVLIDGKRRHASSLVFVSAQGNSGATPVDLDLIPASAVDHIEILTDGAAAQYGSDAIAGVINIILKKGADGGDASITYGQYASSPGGPKAAFGESGHLLGSQGAAIGDQGGFIRLSGDLTLQNPTNQLGEANPYAGIKAPANSKTSPIGVPYQQTTIYYPGDPRNLTADRHVGSQGLPLADTYNFGYNAELPLTSDVKLYSFSTYSHQFARNYGIFRPEDATQNLPAVYPDGYLPQFIIVTDDWQGLAGIKGNDFGGFKWDFSTTYGWNDSHEENYNGLNPSYGPTSPTNFDNGHLIATEWTTNFDLTRAFDTGYFDSPLQVSPGLEFRSNTFQEVAGQRESYTQGPYTFPNLPAVYFYNAGRPPSGGASGLGGFDAGSAGGHSRSNFAAYLDLEQKIANQVDLGLATRLEDYSDVGKTLSGKVSGRWDFAKNYAVRGSVSNGFRAPSLQQEYYQSDLPNLVAIGSGYALVDTKYVTPNSTIGKALGAQPLKPETSIDYTVGFVAEPVEHSHVTLDLYQVSIHDRILQSGSIGSGSAAQLAGVTAALAKIGQTPAIVQYFTNAADTLTRGIDLAADYTTDFGDFGAVKWTAQSAFNWQKIESVKPTPAVLSKLGISTLDRTRLSNLVNLYPVNRTTVGGLWTITDDLELTVRESRYSSTKLVINNNQALASDSRNPSAFITDLDLTYKVLEDVSLTVGANNFFNKFPVKYSYAQSLYDGWYSGTKYNQSSPYGYNGGFYYARLAVTW